MNKSILVWNITQDVKLVQTEDGSKIATTSIATNEYYKDKESWEKKQTTEFHNIVAFGKTAELLENYVKKWAKLLVEWKSKTRSWDAEDGSKKYMTQVHVEKIEFLSSAKKDDGITDADVDDVF